MILPALLVGCCSVGTSESKSPTDHFRAQGTQYADGSIVQVTPKVTSAQAKAIALSAQTGTVDSVELGSENGTAIYVVATTGTDNKKRIVEIDADSGAIQRVVSQNITNITH